MICLEFVMHHAQYLYMILQLHCSPGCKSIQMNHWCWSRWRYYGNCECLLYTRQCLMNTKKIPIKIAISNRYNGALSVHAHEPGNYDPLGYYTDCATVRARYFACLRLCIRRVLTQPGMHRFFYRI